MMDEALQEAFKFDCFVEGIKKSGENNKKGIFVLVLFERG